MKHLLLAAMVMMAGAAWAQSYSTVSGTGTASVVAALRGTPGAATRLVFLSATSDKAGAVAALRTGKSGAAILTASTNAANTNLVIYTTSSPTTNALALTLVPFSTNSVVVFQGYTNLVSTTVFGLLATTNSITAQLAANVGVLRTNDYLFLMDSAVNLPVGAATVNYASDCLWIASPGQPVTLTLDGTSACKVNAASFAQ